MTSEILVTYFDSENRHGPRLSTQFHSHMGLSGCYETTFFKDTDHDELIGRLHSLEEAVDLHNSESSRIAIEYWKAKL